MTRKYEKSTGWKKWKLLAQEYQLSFVLFDWPNCKYTGHKPAVTLNPVK